MNLSLDRQKEINGRAYALLEQFTKNPNKAFPNKPFSESTDDLITIDSDRIVGEPLECILDRHEKTVSPVIYINETEYILDDKGQRYADFLIQIIIRVIADKKIRLYPDLAKL